MPSSRCPPPSPTLGPSLGPGLRLSLSLTLTLSRYGLPLPTSFAQLRGASFGAAWRLSTRLQPYVPKAAAL